MKQYSIGHRGFWRIVMVMTVLIPVTCLMSFIRPWADFYTDHIYIFVREPLTRLTEKIQFPLGEILMYLGAFIIALAAVLLILLIFLHGKRRYRSFVSVYFRSLVIIILTMLLIYSLQWLTPYKSSVLGDPSPSERSYTAAELRIIYLYVIDHLNEECRNVPRDENGKVIYDPKEVTEEKAGIAMNGISDEFPRLRGHYPSIKTALCSDVLEWMWIGGYTYPYTMEMTYNRYTDRFYFPTLYTHESSHHMGYYKEHEANFLAYLACVTSDDPVLRYSGYYNILYYIDDDYYEACLASGAEDMYWNDIEEHPIDPQVISDVIDASLEADEAYQSEEHPLEDFADEATEISEVGWDTQAQILQEYNYDGVVLLLLKYYDGKLY